jgi:hypothetical protein
VSFPSVSLSRRTALQYAFGMDGSCSIDAPDDGIFNIDTQSFSKLNTNRTDVIRCGLVRVSLATRLDVLLPGSPQARATTARWCGATLTKSAVDSQPTPIRTGGTASFTCATMGLEVT